MVFKNVPVAEYTYSGDPLKIDVSYRPNGIIQMLQAVSLDTNIDGAKALSFSYPQLVDGISKKEVAGASLTAVVDDNLDRNDPEVEFALGILAPNRNHGRCHDRPARDSGKSQGGVDGVAVPIRNSLIPIVTSITYTTPSLCHSERALP